MMNSRYKTRKDLIKELQELQMEHNLLITSFEKDITELRQAEEALRESEERYRRLVEGSPDTIAVHSKGKFIYVNPAGVKLIGAQSPQELIGSPILNIVHPDSRSKVIDRLRHVAEGKEAPLFEEKFVKFDGSVIDVEVVGIPITYQGQIATQVVVRDITERKQAESSLKQTLEWQEAIFEGSRDAIFISDQDSRFVVVNNAACDITGYSREQLLKMRIPEIHDLPDLDAYKIYHQRIFGGEEILSEAKILRSDGTKTDTEFNNRCVSIAGKLYMHTTARNIIERKLATAALLESEERFRSLFENSTIGIYRTTPAGQILLANPTLIRILGYSTFEELSKRNLEKEGFEPTYERSKFMEIMKRDNEVAGLESSWVRHDGIQIFVRESARACYDADNKILYFDGTVEDITERKIAEQALEKRTKELQNELEEKKLAEIRLQKLLKGVEVSKLATLKLLEDIKMEMQQRRKAEDEIHILNAELEKRVIERTAQLEAANKELQAFAYSVSHDLRAPLRAIDGFSKFILEDYRTKLDPEGNRLLGLIRSNTQKMDQLITDILALSRVTRGEHKVSKVDMTKMAMSMFNEAASPEIQGKLSFSINELPEANADPTFMKLVWINLISNAIKFSSLKKKPVIKIGGYTKKGFNVYYVRDNGVGFNPEYVHKLFGVFQRLHKTDEFEGTGVGLAIVQRIILRHGGKVWAEGKEGHGATFYFSLPL